MKTLLIIPLLLAAGQDHRRIVDLKVDGMTSQACHVAVEKAIAAIPSVDRVVFRISKDAPRVHVVLKKDARLMLHEVEGALAAARKEMLDTLKMTVDYRLDEAAIHLPEGTLVVIDGKEVKTDAAGTLAEARKVMKLTTARLPEKAHPASAYVCPKGCSAGDGEGICPKCGTALAKVEAPKKAAEG